MAETVPWHEKYGTRFVANAASLTIVWALAWLWLTAHVKPHISAIIFSGVSVATFGVVALAVFGSFFDKNETMAEVARLLKSKTLTSVLLATLPFILFAYATTFTLYLAAADGVAEVRLNVMRGTTPRRVELTSAEKVKAVSYFLAFRPVTASIETIAPTGFKTRVLPLRRGIPLQLTVPNSADARPPYLVRLVPLVNLFYLRGRKEADPRYVVRVFLPGRKQPIVRFGLTFNAIYLGARLEELQSQSKVAATMNGDLHEALQGIDASLTKEEREGIITAWLANPEFIPTPELAPGDKVRVILESPAGKSETTVKITGPVNSAFLEGAGE